MIFYNINVDLFNFFNHGLQSPIFDGIMPIFTHFGGFKFLVLILVAVILYARITKRDTLKKVAIITLGALLFSAAIAFVLKHVVHEPRPFMSLDNVHLLITEDDLNSFPSGHATSTFAVVTSLILNMKELVKKNHLVIDIALVIFAVLIIFSRMYVGVHYPGDVLAGAIVGIVGALIINKFKDRIYSISRLLANKLNVK
ncbi:MAG: phosphatase PAP2 family protein [Methanobrevibacter sp.]|uniref:phosphatase PAP2 family protein n=1 Tax=Methanobrevibacter sp. TaxID=66852 RepID=UPI001B4C8198|nr:phosphatase PAP2 family protein [Methanobrevibacter sp.]MBP3790938.1 phosphatase PAP2 family protein [Methanobrevibacter sp.]